MIHSDWDGKIIRMSDGHALPHSTHNVISSFASGRPIPSTSVGDKSRTFKCGNALKTAERPASNLYYFHIGILAKEHHTKKNRLLLTMPLNA
jgi:hypothetical protein